jgi:signal transduction histidine kinase
MRRQFIRFYLGIVIVLLLAAEIYYFVALRELEKGVDRRLEGTMTPLVEMIDKKYRESAWEPDGRERFLESLNGISPYSINLLERRILSLPLEILKRLDSGEVVAFQGERDRSVYALIGDEKILAIGPISSGNAATPLYIMLLPPLATAILIGAAVYLLIRPIERRIHDLTLTAEKFGVGELGARAEVGSTQSLNELEKAFNRMAGRIESFVEGQSEMLRAVSHELRTPLSRLFFALDDAQSASDVTESRKHLTRIDHSLTELNDLVDELMVYLRLDKDASRPSIEQVDLIPMLADLAAMARELRDGIEIEMTIEAKGPIADAFYLKRALSNLVVNAVRHAKTKVCISCGRESGYFQIVVEDDGPGVSEDKKQKIFDPFYRIDESRSSQGAGLGLAIVARVMQWHGGQARVENSDLGGASFVLSLPEKAKLSMKDQAT